MQSIQYPDGNLFTSDAHTDKEVETLFQFVAAQLLGILASPLVIDVTLTNGVDVVLPSQPDLPNDTWLIYPGQSVSGTGILPGATVVSVDSLAGLVTLSSSATQSGVSQLTFTDSLAFAKVRIGWLRQGQPGPSIDKDTAFIRCTTEDSQYSRLRDNQFSGQTGTFTDVFTRTWTSHWTFYGPSSTGNCKLIQSGLIKSEFATKYLASSKLYINPSIEEPSRGPEKFQGQWWERQDMRIDFNEEITETLTVGTVKSVEVKIYNETGLETDFTVTAP